MGDPTGFVKYRRTEPPKRSVELRVLDWREIEQPAAPGALREQGARCMDCGVPFCQGDTGCPVLNLIPEWNDLVYQGRWRDALERLHSVYGYYLARNQWDHLAGIFQEDGTIEIVSTSNASPVRHANCRLDVATASLASITDNSTANNFSGINVSATWAAVPSAGSAMHRAAMRSWSPNSRRPPGG